MDKISRKFIYFILILSLALPVSVIFEAISFNEVYAAKKERKKPPKARRTQTMSKKVGADFIKAQEALGEEKPDESLKILDRLLSSQELSDFERATIYRLKGYVFAEKEDYQQSMQFLQQSVSYIMR